jgi:hypothetical protein
VPAAIAAAGFFASFNLQLTHKRRKTNQKPASSRAGAAFNTATLAAARTFEVRYCHSDNETVRRKA